MSDLNPCMWNRAQQAALLVTVLVCTLLGMAIGMAAGEAFEPVEVTQSSNTFESPPPLRLAFDA
jgi:hypothetical protein